MAALFGMKWRHGRHLKSVATNRESDSVDRCIPRYLWEEHSWGWKISSRFNLKRRSFRSFSEEVAETRTKDQDD